MSIWANNKMEFKKWWENEGSVMKEGNCESRIIAQAAWQACKGECIKIIERCINEPTAEVMNAALNVVKNELENKIN